MGTETWTWPVVILVLGLAIVFMTLFGMTVAAFVDYRKVKTAAAEAEELRQLVGRYEQLAEKTLDAQQRTATDVSELMSRTVAIEQILRTVDN
jgi:hypothetical protein